jgi:cellulose synthase/poly-beta-1,6-N-acetylglucosamine synthase-like glycosyltransferase
MNEEPTVTIVIPVKPGLSPEALEAVKKLEYPKDRVEVFLVYGRNPSYQRNRVVEQAKGEVIYFLDNDSLPKPQTLKRLVSHLRDKDVAIVGGPSVAPKNLSFLPYLFSKTLESPLCTGSSANRYRRIGKVRETTEKEIILCNMVMRKELYLAFGGLNERLYPNEENELMEKVKHSGFKIIYDPDAYIERMPRRTLWAFIKQIFNYGRGRGEQTVFYPKSFSITNFVPLFFVIYSIFALLKGGVFLFPLYIYFFVLLAYALIKVVKEGDFRLLFLPLTSFLLHLTYGMGTIYGILRAPFKKAFKGEIKIEKVATIWDS